MSVQAIVSAVTEKIIERSRPTRSHYLEPHRGGGQFATQAQGAGLRQHRPWLCRLRPP